MVEAVQCAIEVQQELGDASRDSHNPLRFRIGIHLGDVMIDDTDLLGEGVNLAARLQTMAEPGGVLISQQVYDQVQHKLSVGFEYLGEKRPKNFLEDVAVQRPLHQQWFFSPCHCLSVLREDGTGYCTKGGGVQPAPHQHTMKSRLGGRPMRPGEAVPTDWFVALVLALPVRTQGQRSRTTNQTDEKQA